MSVPTTQYKKHNCAARDYGKSDEYGRRKAAK
jgi:hypothetical protein